MSWWWSSSQGGCHRRHRGADPEVSFLRHDDEKNDHEQREEGAPSPRHHWIIHPRVSPSPDPAPPPLLPSPDPPFRHVAFHGSAAPMRCYLRIPPLLPPNFVPRLWNAAIAPLPTTTALIAELRRCERERGEERELEAWDLCSQAASQ
ncbi:Os08g0425900 [Oryza sativa Japonica Group]|uniref:Os08g0425900 protein n=1 Tax=Oryza sativa subsp. japonica TaxID=39947 RepID=A0A0P0XFX9_ORYSJ|nr:Os08g0425900 [Oryza sativa Japonica Group]